MGIEKENLKDIYDTIKDNFNNLPEYDENNKDYMIHVLESAIWQIINTEASVETIVFKNDGLNQSTEEEENVYREAEINAIDYNKFGKTDEKPNISEYTNDMMKEFNEFYDETQQVQTDETTQFIKNIDDYVDKVKNLLKRNLLVKLSALTNNDFTELNFQNENGENVQIRDAMVGFSFISLKEIDKTSLQYLISSDLRTKIENKLKDFNGDVSEGSTLIHISFLRKIVEYCKRKYFYQDKTYQDKTYHKKPKQIYELEDLNILTGIIKESKKHYDTLYKAVEYHENKNKLRDTLENSINEKIKNKCKSVLTYLKLRNDENNNKLYNQRFQIKLNEKVLRVDYINDNTSFYRVKSDRSIMSSKDDKHFFNGKRIKKARDDAYVTFQNEENFQQNKENFDPIRTYYFGEFTRIFTPDKKNTYISENMGELLEEFKEGKPILLFGYGSSGAGKTSSLIHFKGIEGKRSEDGIAIHLINKLVEDSKLGNITKLQIKFLELWKENNEIKTKDDEKEFEFDTNGKWKNGQEELGKVLIELIDTNRKVQATPNNPNSSRSHALLYICVGEKYKIIIGDLAGVENSFNCNDERTIREFANVRKDNGKELFYNVGTSATVIRLNETVGFFDLDNPSIEDLLDKNNFDGDKFTKNVKIMRKFFDENGSYIDIDFGDIKNLNEDKIYEKIYNKFNFKKAEEIIDGLNSDKAIYNFNIDNDRVKLTHERLNGNSKKEYKSISGSGIILPKAENRREEIEKRCNSLNFYCAKRAIRHNLAHLLNRNNNNIDKDNPIPEELKSFLDTAEINRFLEKTDYQNFAKEQEQKQEQKQEQNDLYGDKANYKDNKQTWDDLMDMNKRIVGKIKELKTQKWKVLVGGTHVKGYIDNDNNVNRFLNIFKSNNSFDKPKDLVEKIQEIINNNNVLQDDNFDKYKSFVESMISFNNIRTQEIKSICQKRTEEGEYINKSLLELTKSINDIIYEKNKESFMIVPNYVDFCYNQYCFEDNYFFGLSEDRNKDKVKKDKLQSRGHLMSCVQNLLGEDDDTKFKKDIVICAFGVFNISRNANNPPPVPYIDINKLKNIYYGCERNAEMNNEIKNTFGKIEKSNNTGTITPNNFNDKLNSLFSVSGMYDMNVMENIKKIVDGNMDVDNEDYNRYTKEFIDMIDNSNAASTIGTLEFLDKISKMNITRSICAFNYGDENSNMNVSDLNDLYRKKNFEFDDENKTQPDNKAQSKVSTSPKKPGSKKNSEKKYKKKF